MAKTSNKANKTPGRMAQLVSVYRMTIRADSTALWWSLLALAIGVLVGLLASILFAGSNVFTSVAYIVTGVLAGILAAMIVMSRRAERAAYSQIAGQAGAAGAVLGSSLRRNWRSPEMPVAISPKTKDAVWRALGPGGVVLVGEGSRTRVQSMLEDERRKIQRIAPGVPVSFLYVTGDQDSVPLHKLASSLYKMKKTLNRTEIAAVDKRLSAIAGGMPIPKGIDPNRVRASRK
jgi:uncharacterized membrane protein YeaQ/YmgE (transglycosylase-associated protein family)